MVHRWSRNWVGGVVLGILVGLAVGALWPHSPISAVTTDRIDTYAMATGFVDEGVEAVYYLDYLTGTLRAAVLSNQTRDFQARYEANIAADLMNVIGFQNANLQAANAQRAKAGLSPLPELQMPQNPRYLIVTGQVDIRRGGAARLQPGASAVYVAETNTGIVLAYVVPWDRNAHAANQPAAAPLTLWAGDRFASAVIRSQ